MTGQSGPAGGRRSPAIVLVPLVLITIALVATTVLVLPPGPTPSPEGSRPPTRAPTEGSAAVPAPPVAPLLVSLRVAGPAVVGMPLRISAAALGTAGIAALDMWVGGSQLELQRTSDPERPAATARWEWRPDAAGPQVLVARAYDALGRMAQSAPVRLEVTAEPPRTFRLEEVTARAGRPSATWSRGAAAIWRSRAGSLRTIDPGPCQPARLSRSRSSMSHPRRVWGTSRCSRGLGLCSRGRPRPRPRSYRRDGTGWIATWPWWPTSDRSCRPAW